MDEAQSPQPGVQIYDISGQTPVLGEVPHEDLQAALESGKYSLPQGVKVPVINPDGDVGHIPSEDAIAAFQQGYNYATPEDLKTAKYTTPGQKVLAGLEGFGKGLLGPIATGAETMAGVNPEDIRGREEKNPFTHGIPEAVGLIAPALLTGGESLATRLTQQGAIEAGGKAALKALGIPTGAALEAAKPLVKIGSTAAKFAADNAIYQIGNEASSAILQDPNQDIGHAAIDVGLAGLLGGVAGGALGSVSPMWEASMGGKTGTWLKAIKDRMGGIDSVVPNATKEVLETSGLGKDIDPFIKAGLTDIPELKEAFNTLMQSDTTKAGLTAQEKMKDFIRLSSDTTARAFGVEPEELANMSKISHAARGSELGDILAKEVDSKMEPIAKAYEDIKDKYGKMELPGARSGVDQSGQLVETPALVDSIAEKISQLTEKEGWNKSLSSPEMKMAHEVIADLPLQKNTQDISNLIKTNNSKIYSDPMNSAKRSALGKINSILRDAEGDAISFHLGEDQGLEAVQAFKQTRQAFAKQAQLTDVLDSRLHLKGASTSGYGSAIRDFANERGEQFLRRMSGNKDAYLLNFIQENYPESAQALRKYHLDTVLKTASDRSGEGLNASRVLAEIKKMSPELQSFAIPPEAMAKAEQIGAITDKLHDSHFNFSNTARVLDKLTEHLPGSALGVITALMGHNPALAWMMGKMGSYLGKDAPDAVRYSLLKYLGSNNEMSAKGFKSMFDTVAHTIKGENLAGKAVKNLFKAGVEVLPEHLLPSEKDRQKIDKRIQKLKENPEQALDVAGNIGHYLPDHAVALGSQAGRALQYLDSVKPKDSATSPFAVKPTHSAVQQAEYKKALNIAQQPLVVLDKIKKGTVTVGDVKHLKSIYPSLYNSLSQKVSSQLAETISKKEPVPYQTRLGVSLFTGQTIDPTMQPQCIMAAQPEPQPSPGSNEPKSGGKHSLKDLGKLPQAAQTPLQARQAKETSAKP